MLQDPYGFGKGTIDARIQKMLKNYNTGLFGHKTRKDLPLGFIVQEIDRPYSETKRITESLEKDGCLRLYTSPETPTEIMVSAYISDGMRLI